MQINEKIKKLRKDKKLKQAEFAEMLGVTQGTVSKIENGRLYSIPHKMIMNLRKVFKVNLNKLVD